MEIESRLVPEREREQRPLFDAVLVHGYWLSQRGESGRLKMSSRSHIAARAAMLLYNKGRGAQNIVLTAGQVWGKEYPSSAKMMADELIRKYKIPAERIIVADTAINTDDEVAIFLELAAKKW